MAMVPPIVARKQRLQMMHEVDVAAGARLEDGNTRGGMWNKHIDQPIAQLGHERGNLGR